MLTVSKISVCSKQVSTLSLPKKNGGRLSFAFHLLHFLVGEARVAHAIGWKIAGVHLKRSNLSKGCKTLFCTGSNLGEFSFVFCSQKWSYNWLYSADWQLRTHWNSHMTAGTNEPKAFSHIFQLSQFVLLSKCPCPRCGGANIWIFSQMLVQIDSQQLHPDEMISTALLCIAMHWGGEPWWLVTQVAALRGATAPWPFPSGYWVFLLNPP